MGEGERRQQRRQQRKKATLKRMDGYPQASESIVLPISFNLSSTYSYVSLHEDIMDKIGW